MLYFPIQALPEETQALVVERVAGNSFGDHYRLRATYMSMKALSERRRVYHFFDVLNFLWGVSMPPNMLETCFEEGNFSTLYMRGVQLFYTFDLKDEGLAYIKRSADGGYERAVYTYAVTRKIYWDDEDYLSLLSRDFLVRLGRQSEINNGVGFLLHSSLGYRLGFMAYLEDQGREHVQPLPLYQGGWSFLP
ncbi:hypothetical protein F2Q70_00036168 [Brassica cretica]|uniref:At2g35280-like TPR domain-containing protein n=1 Tax=Brassica cretica TaxID=69181 RepID=A0A8S9G4D5_BRACR|nr:hypothetical protein F2Q68_00031355 [Brassica cretica]KAF2586059.1 hypothetical protein F2Q70_00036168 [Brassica cretica]